MKEIPKKELKDYCKNFITTSLEICEDTSNQYPVELADDYYPKFLNKKFDDISKKQTKNYEEFVYKNEDALTSTEDFELLNSFISEQQTIKEFFQDFRQNYSGISTKNVEEDTRDLLFVFLQYYLEINDKFDYSQKSFDIVFNNFFNYVSEGINHVSYFTPLYNFEAIKDELVFDNIVVRRITEDEFKIVTRLGNGPGQTKTVNPDFVNLQYILETTLPRKTSLKKENLEAKERFSKLTQSMTLLFAGNIVMGSLYRNYSNPWARIRHFIDGHEPDFFSNKRLRLTPKKYDSLLSFYKSFKEVELSKKEYKFLKMAISRFELAMQKKQSEDKIVDYMISLESLFTSGPGETRMKMSNRISVLMGDSEEDKEKLWYFLNAAYNIRSGIVHGEGIRSKQIMNKEYTLDEISSKLEEITRISIRKMLNLTKHFAGKKQSGKIIDAIDVGLINRKKLVELQQKSNDSI